MGREDADATTVSSTVPSDSSASPAVQDVMEVGCPLAECGFVPLEPATYSIDPDLDPST